MVKLKKINDEEWEIPMTDDMLVPGRIFASEEFIELIKDDKSLEQVMNVAKLPGILKASYAMPDIHQGYGFPIGGVAAFDLESGVISPGGVGYDINCSVRLLKTNLKSSDLKGKEKELSKSLFNAVPSGVGRKGSIRLTQKELEEFLIGGAKTAIEKGYGEKTDFEYIEEEGKMSGANPTDVSTKAKGRGMNQLGTLGAGNHFLDVLVVDEIFNDKTAKVFGLIKDQVVVMIHCGSRGLGHQVASDYIQEMAKVYGFPSFSKDLVNAPIKSELGKKYLSAMSCAANFAFANKQIITHLVRKDLESYFPNFKAEVVYDICHNIAKIEKHEGKEILIMRKGATRRIEIPEKYRSVGQPVLLPGSMGTPSYVLTGTNEAEEKSFSSTAHGAGRIRSRTKAKEEMTFEDATKDMESRGVFVEYGSNKGMIEESPFSYKDIDEVVRISDTAGLGKKVAKLRPVLVIIG